MPQPHYSTRNLLRETVDYLQSHGLRPEDIRGVMVSRAGHAGTWADFARLADRDYTASGYGIDDTLILLGDGWWVERGRDAGGEWWQIRRTPALPADSLPLVLKDIFQHL